MLKYDPVGTSDPFSSFLAQERPERDPPPGVEGVVVAGGGISGGCGFPGLKEFEKGRGTLTRGVFSEKESSFPRTETRRQITTSLSLAPPP